MRTLSPQESSESSKKKQIDFQNTTRSSTPIEALLLYRTRGPVCVSENSLDSVLIIFLQFYCNDHLLRRESSNQKRNDFQNTTRSSTPIEKIIFFCFYCNNHLLTSKMQNYFQNTTRSSTPIDEEQRIGLCCVHIIFFIF